jgi:hypothetical protein
MRARTINGSPRRTASAAWAEVERMVTETLVPASAIDDGDVAEALAALRGVGPMLVAAGVLSDQPVVLRALPLELEITVALGNAALHGDDWLGKVTGAATTETWGLFVPDPEPFGAEVREAVAAHEALQAGAPPATADTGSRQAALAGFAVDAEALRKISGGGR